jgi:hypothetical protein
MSKSKGVWIPSIIAIVAAILFLGYYYHYISRHGNGESDLKRLAEEQLAKGFVDGNVRIAIFFNDLGTISVFLGAVCFSWLLFKRKLRSPSRIVRRVGKLFHSLHIFLGWISLFLCFAHGIYFFFVEIHDQHIYSGISSFVILLTIAGYGYGIRKVSNKEMRAVHRWLSIVWIPILWIHAGGEAILAAMAALGAGGIVLLLERMASGRNGA